MATALKVPLCTLIYSYKHWEAGIGHFDEKSRENARENETLKAPKKLVIFASNSTYKKFRNESQANHIF